MESEPVPCSSRLDILKVYETLACQACPSGCCVAPYIGWLCSKCAQCNMEPPNARNSCSNLCCPAQVQRHPSRQPRISADPPSVPPLAHTLEIAHQVWGLPAADGTLAACHRPTPGDSLSGCGRDHGLPTANTHVRRTCPQAKGGAHWRSCA